MPAVRSLLALVLAATALAGCSSLFRDRAGDYRTARELPPLKLPAGQEARPIQPLYPIPPGPALSNVDTSKKFEVPKPKPLVLDAATALWLRHGSSSEREAASVAGTEAPPQRR